MKRKDFLMLVAYMLLTLVVSSSDQVVNSTPTLCLGGVIIVALLYLACHFQDRLNGAKAKEGSVEWKDFKNLVIAVRLISWLTALLFILIAFL